MNRHFSILFLFLVLSSCCKDGVELEPYLLSDSEKVSIPYSPNETVPFIHTNGFEFDLTVTGQQIEWRTTETEHCGDNWAKYETLIYDLNSTIPEFHIKLEVYPKEINRYISISINNKTNFGLYLPGEPDIDTLIINGNTYANIFKAESYWSDTLLINPKQILYAKEVGIIQITMSDSTQFTINE